MRKVISDMASVVFGSRRPRRPRRLADVKTAEDARLFLEFMENSTPEQVFPSRWTLRRAIGELFHRPSQG